MTDTNDSHDASELAPRDIARTRIPPARLDEIERRLLAAEAAADFVPELATLWGKGKRTVWRYVAIVRARLAERAQSRAIAPEADAELVRALALETYRVARTGNEKGSDTKGMAAAVRLLAEMTGNVGPRRVEISGPNGGPVQTHAAVVVLPELDADGAVAPKRWPADPVSGE